MIKKVTVDAIRSLRHVNIFEWVLIAFVDVSLLILVYEVTINNIRHYSFELEWAVITIITMTLLIPLVFAYVKHIGPRIDWGPNFDDSVAAFISSWILLGSVTVLMTMYWVSP